MGYHYLYCDDCMQPLASILEEIDDIPVSYLVCEECYSKNEEKNEKK
jgi:hypothetical protein